MSRYNGSHEQDRWPTVTDYVVFVVLVVILVCGIALGLRQ